MSGLTPKQSQTLGFISSFIAQHGYSPTVREIMAGIGTSSSGETQRLIDQLRDRGKITSLPRRSRSIELVRAA